MDAPRSPVPEGVSVVVPVFESASTLPALAKRLGETLAPLVDDYEIVLVNDGSRDGSWETILALSDADSRLRGIDLMRNYGQHNALLCGIRSARHGVVLTLDDDLQHPPEEIPKLLGRLHDDCDVVYGVPESEQHGLWRDLASRMTKWALRATLGAQTAQKVSAFRAFRTELRQAFAAYRGSFVSLDVLLGWGARRVDSVEVRHEPRPVGESHYTFRKLVNHAFNMITGFSVLPLQIASLVGFALTFFGLAVLGFVVVRYFVEGSAVPGFAFLASIISIFSGAQLFALGIVGEYLARMHFRIMDRPAYAVRRLTVPDDHGARDGSVAL